MKKQQFQPLTPAALYARVSSDRQDVDLSVVAQLRALRDYANNNVCSVARKYVDKAESGRIADRPQLRKIIDEDGRDNAPFQARLIPGSGYSDHPSPVESHRCRLSVVYRCPINSPQVNGLI